MKRLSLTVPKPCSETWNNFTQTASGGYCTSCSKAVVDFTKQSDDEIMDFFNHKPAHTCGRFRPDQLKNYSYSVPTTIHPGLKLLKAGLLSLLMLLMSKESSAQNPSAEAQSEVVQYERFPVEKSFAGKMEHVVKGVVKTTEDNLPVSGVNIYLKASTAGTASEANGQFEFPQKLKEGDVLVFTFIGFDTQEYKVPNDAREVIEIEMTLGYTMLLGEVVADGVYTTEPSGLSRWWQKVKGLF